MAAFQEDFFDQITNVHFADGVNVSFFYESDFISFSFDIIDKKAKLHDISTAVLPEGDQSATFQTTTYAVSNLKGGHFLTAKTNFSIPSGAAPANLLVITTPHDTVLTAQDLLFVLSDGLDGVLTRFPTLMVAAIGNPNEAFGSSAYGIPIAGPCSMPFSIKKVTIRDTSGFQIQVFPTGGATAGSNGVGSSWQTFGYGIWGARLGLKGDTAVYVPAGQGTSTMTDNNGDIFGQGYAFGRAPQLP